MQKLRHMFNREVKYLFQCYRAYNSRRSWDLKPWLVNSNSVAVLPFFYDFSNDFDFSTGDHSHYV